MVQDQIEKDNTSDIDHTDPSSNSSVGMLKVTSIIGDQVYTPNGDPLGFIKDLMFNLYDGSLEHIVIIADGLPGLENELFTVPVEAMLINFERKIFLMNGEIDELHNAPSCVKYCWLETNQQNTNEFKGVDEDPELRWQDISGRSELKDII